MSPAARARARACACRVVRAALAALSIALSSALGATLGTQAAAESARGWSLSEDRRVLTVAPAEPLLRARLRVAGAAEGAPLAIGRAPGGGASLTSPWPLLRGVAYQVDLVGAGGVRTLSVAAEAPAAAARVRRIAPGGPAAPANLLRVHVYFDAPMARGGALRHVRLLDAEGAPIAHAFLNLGVELWSPDHTRLTLMLDPGRLKRGVGPNRALGAPLEAGRRYAVEVGRGLRDAYGRPLAAPARAAFTAAPAERRALDPDLWTLELGENALRVRFDRVMDAPSVALAVLLRDGRGGVARGRRQAGGAGWSWPLAGLDAASGLRLSVGRAVEDAAGNTLCSPFDAALGRGETCAAGAEIMIPGRP